MTIYQGANRYPVDEIAIHCSATSRSWLESKTKTSSYILASQVTEIRRWHTKDNGWRDIGYHWILGRSGLTKPGRRQTEIGAGILNHNRGVIHICLIGGRGSSSDDQFYDHFTENQDLSLKALIKQLGSQTRIKLLTGHNDYAAKACPGFKVSDWIAARGGFNKILGYAE